MAAPAPGCDTPGSRDTALAPPGTAGTSGAGVALEVPGRAATKPFLSCLRASCSRPQLPLAAIGSWAARFQFTPRLAATDASHPELCHPAPVPPQTLPLCSCATPDSATPDPATLLLCHRRHLHPTPVPPCCCATAHTATLVPTTGYRHITVPGHPRGTQAEGQARELWVPLCTGGRPVASLLWQPPGQGRKRPRSRCAVEACGFLAAVSAWPGAASHARPRTGCPPTTPGPSGSCSVAQGVHGVL